MAGRRRGPARASVRDQQRTHPAEYVDGSAHPCDGHRGDPLGYLGPEHSQALDLCAQPTSVAEIAGHLKLPAGVTKVLLSDLVDCQAITTKPPTFHDNPTDRSLLEAVLDGLRRQL